MAESSRKKYNLLKWIGGVILFIVTLLGTASWHISVKIRPTVTSELKSLVMKATDSLYRVEFSDIRTNVITGNAALINVKIIPNPVILKKLIKLKKAPNNIYTVQLRKLMIRGFHPKKLYQDHKLNVDLLLFDKPDIVMVNKQFDYNEDKLPRPVKSPYQYIAPYLKELRVQSIAFRDIKFKYINNNALKPEKDEIDNLNVTLTDWLIDPNSANDPSRMYLLKDISVRLKDYTYPTPDSLYHINVNQIDFQAATGKLNVKKFGLIPRYKEMQFGNVAENSNERFNVQMSNISMSGINFPLYLLKQELFAKQMNVNFGSVTVFNSNQFKGPAVPRTGKYPHQLFQAFKGLVTVQKLKLESIDINYAEFDNNSRQKGMVTFEKTSGTITNVTNSPKFKFKDPIMIADLTTYMMGRGKLDVFFRFDLKAKDGAFSYNGSLTDFNGKALNRITKPLGRIQIKSGYVNKLDFSIKANNRLASGQVNFNYQDLNVGLLKKEEGKDNLVKLGWASFLANNLVINTNNPDRNGNFVSANIKYQREPSATFFSFIWRTLFEGIKYSVGLTEEKKAQISSRIEQFKKIKTDREKRKARREKRKSN